MEDSTPPIQAPKKTSYREIASNQMLLTKTAMNELRAHINFTQLRFHCKKNNPGRTFHITTAANNAGEAIVQYFSGTKSCKHIRDMNVSNWKEDGYYWIDPASDGTYLKVFCDMTTDGGAWLLASKFVMQNSTPPAQAPLKTSYRGIASNQMLLTKTAMNQLRTHMNFTQLRFHCKKQTTGRTFHITTAANSLGEAVVQYFSGQTDVLPYACGSFVKMNDDNSRLAEKCHEWGNSKNGGWLLVSKVVMEDSTPPIQAPKKTSYREIASNQMLLTKTAMNELRAHINFTQLRFHCKKNNPGRTFHITTAANNAGEAIVQYFSGQTDVMPRS
ncbi:uncharacterized protein [Montipora foliosa]|uniref:uncharacterized protein n=1 Tax=Montipora foliosa TaxID=591990 RepID=UPI0035F16D06